MQQQRERGRERVQEYKTTVESQTPAQIASFSLFLCFFGANYCLRLPSPPAARLPSPPLIAAHDPRCSTHSLTLLSIVFTRQTLAGRLTHSFRIAGCILELPVVCRKKKQQSDPSLCLSRSPAFRICCFAAADQLRAPGYSSRDPLAAAVSLVTRCAKAGANSDGKDC